MLSSKILHITESLSGFYPELSLIFGIITLMLIGLFKPDFVRNYGHFLVNSLLIITIILELNQYIACADSDTFLFLSMIKISNLSIILRILLTLGTYVMIQYTGLSKSLKNYQEYVNMEFYVLVLSLLLGANMMILSNNFLMLFISIEFISLVSYTLVTFSSDQRFTREAAMKYFVFGATTAAIMAYGISWIYTYTNSLSYYSITTFLFENGNNSVPTLFWAGVLMTSVGLLFKLSIVPFHFWTPDVYQGSSYKVASLFAYVPKVAAIGVFMIFFEIQYFHVSDVLKNMIAVLAIVTMLIGNLGALRQTDIKRLLAYSSIAQSGFVIVGLLSSNTSIGLESMTFYLFIYVFLNFTTFIAIDWLGEVTKSTEIKSFAGLSKTFPLFSFLITLAMIGLVGLPPTVGFSAKFMILQALMLSEGFSKDPLLVTVFIVAVFTAVLSLFYYLKLPYFLYIKEFSIKKELKISYAHKIFIVLVSIPIILGFIAWSLVLDIINMFVA